MDKDWKKQLLLKDQPDSINNKNKVLLIRIFYSLSEHNRNGSFLPAS